MKKNLVFLLLAITCQVFAQTNLITGINISLPSNPDANIAEWSKSMPPLMISARTRMENGRVSPMVMESRILVSIKGNGAVCGSYTKANAPASNFNSPAKVWSGETALNLLGKTCVLKPGIYEFCVQFYGEGAVGQVLIGEGCKSFTIKETEQLTYQPPQLLAPVNETELSDADSKKPMTFRWTPVIPKPQEPLTYRLTVWQLMQGQTGVQAMRVNQPIITKDVDNITQALINNIIDGPCKPPLICNFVWNVQALNREGKPIGSNNGTSEVNEFSIMGNYSINIENLVVECPKGTIYSFTVNVGNPNNQVAIFDKIEIVSVNGSLITPINITTTSPAIGSTISSNGNINVSGSFNYASTINIVSIKAYIKEQANPLLNTASSYTTYTLQGCICHDCDKALFSFTPSGITPDANSNQYNIAGNISVSGLPAVYGIEIEMQSYSYNATPSACSNGITSLEESGMFLIPGTTINGLPVQLFNETASGSSSSNLNASKIIKLSSTSALSGNIPINLLVGMPGPIPGLNKDCCKIKYEVCIKVKVFYDQKTCKSCTFTKCFPFSNQ